MSVAVMGDVWKYSMASGNDLLLLLGIADHATDEGLCWPSIRGLAIKTRVSESTVKRAIKTLVKLGELRIEESGGTFGTGTVGTKRLANKYRVLRGKREYIEGGGQIEPRSQSEPGARSKAMNPGPGSQLRPSNHHKQSPNTKTKSVSLAPGDGNGADQRNVVIVSFACAEDDHREAADKLIDEFGPFSAKQSRFIQDYIDKDHGYVLRQAEIVRSEPRDNAAKAFMAALRDDWQPRKATVKPRPAKQPPPIVEEPVRSDEEWEKQRAAAQAMKATVALL